MAGSRRQPLLGTRLTEPSGRRAALIGLAVALLAGGANQTVPAQTVPAETVPTDKVPTDKVPTDKVPTGAAAPEAVPVGIAGRWEQLVLPGPELEVVPQVDRAAPLLVRIVATYPHGDAFRYDLEYYGLEPGRYDLADYLRPKATSPGAAAPFAVAQAGEANSATATSGRGAGPSELSGPLRRGLQVEITSTMPAGQITPAPLAPTRLPRVGGYRLLGYDGGAIWLITLAVLLCGGRRRAVCGESGPEQISLADQLRPLVQRASVGTITVAEQARLEALLLHYWARRRGWTEVAPAEMLVRLRSDSESGPLFQQLERWLYHPGAEPDVPLADLLAPYQHVTAGDLSHEAGAVLSVPQARWRETAG